MAQAILRHSDLKTTLNVYTPRYLNHKSVRQGKWSAYCSLPVLFRCAIHVGP